MQGPAPNGATGEVRSDGRPIGLPRGRGLVLPFLLLVGGMLLAGVMFAGAAPNNPPTVVTSGGTLAYTEDDGAVTFDGGMLVDDLDADPIQSATVQFSAGYVGTEDELASSGGGGISASWDSGSGALTLSGAAPASTYQIVLRQVTYENTSQLPNPGTRTVSITVTDGIDPSAASTRDIAVTSVPDNPQLSLTSGSLAYIESSGPVAIDVGANVVDDEDDLTSASFSITGGYVPAEDSLDVPGLGGIAGSWDAGTATLTLSGSGTTSEWQAAVRTVTYENTSNNPTTAPRTVNATITDGTATSPAATRVVAITSVNDPPSPGGDVVIEAPGGGAMAVAEDTPSPSAANIRVVPATLFDIEGPTPVAVRITSVTGGTLAQGDGTALGLGTGGSILSLASGSVDLRFTPTANRDLDATFTYVVVDAANPGINSPASNATIPITPVNDAPALAGSGGSAGFVENGGAVVVDNALVITDIDSATIAGATAQITGGFAAGDDTLAATASGGVSVNWDGSTGTLSLSGSASLPTYQSILRSVTFDNPSENPAASNRTVSFAVDDGTDGSNVIVRNVTVTPGNDAPTVTAGGAATYVENDPAVVVDAGVTPADVDSAILTSATVQITGGFVSSEDVLGSSGGAGVAATWDGGSGTLTLTGSASIATYQNLLQAVTYVNPSDAPTLAARTISYSIVDDGAAPSSASTATVTISSVNDSPAISGGGGSVIYTENDSAIVIDNAITIADLDDANLESAQVRVATNGSDTEDVLGFTNQNGISGAWSPASGTLTLSGSATLADYEAALESITYFNVSDDPSTATRTIEFTIDDGDDVNGPIENDVAVVAMNDAPTIGLDPDPITYVENDPTTPIDAALTVTDLDDTQIERVDLMTTSWRNGQDSFVVTPSGGITVTYDAVTGTLVLIGPAPTSSFETVLRSVRFHNPSEAPTAGTRNFALVADDGDATGPSVDRDLILTAINDAPVAANDSAEVLQGAWIAVDVIGNDTDVDGGYLRITGWDAHPDVAISKTAGMLKVVPHDDFVGIANVSYRVGDGRGGEDTGRLRLRARAAADGSVFISALPTRVAVGSPITEAVKVRNWGAGILENVRVTISIPGATVRVTSAPSGVSCTVVGSRAMCPLGDLAAGSRPVVMLEATPEASGLVTATATLRHSSIDPDDADLVSAATTVVLARPGIVPTPGGGDDDDDDDDDDDGGGGGWRPPATAPTTPVPTTTVPTTTVATTTVPTTTVPTTTTVFEDTIDDIPTTEATTTAAPTTVDHGDGTGLGSTAPPTTVGESGGSGSPVNSLLVFGMFAAAAAVFVWQRQRRIV